MRVCEQSARLLGFGHLEGTKCDVREPGIQERRRYGAVRRHGGVGIVMGGGDGRRTETVGEVEDRTISVEFFP